MLPQMKETLIAIITLAITTFCVFGTVLDLETEGLEEPDVTQPSGTLIPTQSPVPETKEGLATQTPMEREMLQTALPSTIEEELPLGSDYLAGWPYGSCNAVTSDGNYLYIGTGGAVIIVDVTDPSNPQEISSYVTPDAVMKLFKDDHYLYIANRKAGLRIIDVSDPFNPVEIGSNDTENTSDIFVSYPYAYLVAGGDLRIVDISDPTNPVVVGIGILINEFSPWGVYVIDNYAYIALSGGLQIFDVSDPSTPVELGLSRTEQAGAWCSVYVHNDHAYHICAHSGLHIIDVSNPSNPFEVNSLYASNWIWDVDGTGNYVYVHIFDAGLRVLDISEPSNPVEVGGYVYETNHDYGDIDISGNYAYVTHTYKGVRIFDISDPTIPEKMSFFETSGTLYDVQVSDSYAYVANGDLHVLDISNPTNPVKVGSLFTPDDATSVFVHGNLVYLSGVNGLYIIDITNPSSPKKIGFFDPSSDADAAGGGIHFDDDYIYLAREPRGVFIIDVSDPSSPQQAGHFYDNSYETSFSDVFVLDDHAYLTAPWDDAHAGLYVLDVSNPENPVEVSFSPMVDPPTSVQVVGNYAYVTSSHIGLHVFDIIDPSIPIEVSTFDIRNIPYAGGAFVDEVYFYEGYAFMTLRWCGLLILDVNNPSNPVEAGHIDSTEGFGVYAYNHYLYVVDLDYGLRIYSIEQLLGSKINP